MSDLNILKSDNVNTTELDEGNLIPPASDLQPLVLTVSGVRQFLSNNFRESVPAKSGGRG
jgi:hypothetical protein